MRGPLSVVLSMRLTKADLKRLDRLAARLPIRRLTLLREAMRFGLEALERDPTLLFAAPKRARPR